MSNQPVSPAAGSTSAAGSAAPGTGSATQQAPGAADHSSAQASAGMPARRALETGARGWRWTLKVSMLAVLPVVTLAGEPLAEARMEHRLERGQVLVPTVDALVLATPLTTPPQAQAYLRTSAAATPPARSWIDVWFGAIAPPRDAAVESSAFAAASAERFTAGTLTLLDR